MFDDRATDVRMTTNHGVTTVTFGDTHVTVKLSGIQNSYSSTTGSNRDIVLGVFTSENGSSQPVR